MRLFYIIMFCVLSCIAIIQPGLAVETREFGSGLATTLQRDAGELRGAPLLNKARLALLCFFGGDALRDMLPPIPGICPDERGSRFVSEKDGFVIPRDQGSLMNTP